MAASLPAALPHLTAQEAAIDGIYRTITAWDRADETLLRSAMTEDAVFTLGDYVQHGIDEVIENNFNQVSRMGTTHSLSAIRVNITGSSAKAACNAVAMHVPTGTGLEPGHKFFQVGSLYDMDLVLGQDGLWKVKAWTLTPVWSSGDQAIMSP